MRVNSLAEGIAGRQLVKAHAQHGVTSVHPALPTGPGRTSGDGGAGGNLDTALAATASATSWVAPRLDQWMQ